jgi:hypothetical protein
MLSRRSDTRPLNRCRHILPSFNWVGPASFRAFRQPLSEHKRFNIQNRQFFPHHCNVMCSQPRTTKKLDSAAEHGGVGTYRITLCSRSSRKTHISLHPLTDGATDHSPPQGLTISASAYSRKSGRWEHPLNPVQHGR